MTLMKLIQKMSLMTLLITCLSLSSCKNQTFDITVERCFPVTEFNKCRCHEYRISDEYTGRVSDSYDKSLNYCTRFVAFSARDYVEILDLFRQFGNQVETKDDLLKTLEKVDASRGRVH